MINLGKTYAKLTIFPKMFCKSGPWLLVYVCVFTISVW